MIGRMSAGSKHLRDQWDMRGSDGSAHTRSPCGPAVRRLWIPTGPTLSHQE